MNTTVSYDHGPQVSDGRFLYSFYLSAGQFWYCDLFRLVSISQGSPVSLWDPNRLTEAFLQAGYVRTGQQR